MFPLRCVKTSGNIDTVSLSGPRKTATLQDVHAKLRLVLPPDSESSRHTDAVFGCLSLNLSQIETCSLHFRSSYVCVVLTDEDEQL